MATEPSQPVPGSAQALLNVSSAIPGLIRLPTGLELNEEQAEKLAAEKPVRLIVFAGAVDCGKTTLLTCLYEMFQGGPVHEKQFAGCHTLPAFEKKCHLGRADSGNEQEDTGRNIYEGPNPEFVHLKLQNGSKALGHIDFLFTDVSGEMFEHARNSTEECKKLKFLQKASHILIFLDCDKLFQPAKRWGMVKDAKTLLRSCLDSGMIHPECIVTVVWAKCDFVQAAQGKDQTAANNFIAEAEGELRAAFAQRIKNFKFHRTAARPSQCPALEVGFGLGDLIQDWVTQSGVPWKSDVETTAADGRQQK